jgi:hypothetical protein
MMCHFPSFQHVHNITNLAMLVKLYGATSESAKGRYSPAECIGAVKHRIEGNPDPKHVSTSQPSGKI